MKVPSPVTGSGSSKALVSDNGSETDSGRRMGPDGGCAYLVKPLVSSQALSFPEPSLYSLKNGPGVHPARSSLLHHLREEEVSVRNITPTPTCELRDLTEQAIFQS